tara:strand:- start:340 stop:531 length:192 start_codon:yes stop_codon:yes gene_type:complete
MYIIKILISYYYYNNMMIIFEILGIGIIIASIKQYFCNKKNNYDIVPILPPRYENISPPPEYS